MSAEIIPFAPRGGDVLAAWERFAALARTVNANHALADNAEFMAAVRSAQVEFQTVFVGAEYAA